MEIFDWDFLTPASKQIIIITIDIDIISSSILLFSRHIRQNRESENQKKKNKGQKEEWK